MKVFVYMVIFALLLINFSFPQSVIWNHTYGGDAYDEANAVQKTLEGGYIFAGYTQSFGLGRYGNGYVVKTDENGDTLWTRLYGSDGMDVFADMVVTPDSGCIAVGLTDTPTNFENIYVVKVDKNGNTVFEKNFGGTEKDVALSIAPSDDGGFVMTGGTKSFSVGEEDLFLFKINSSGDSLWFKTYGTTGNDPGYGINPTNDGGFIITGLYNWSDAWLIKADANGDTIWTKTFGGTDYDEANSAIQTPDNGFVLCGSTSSMGAGELDAYVVKTDSLGNLEWENTYGGSGYDEGRRILSKPGGGYIIMANTDSQISGEFNYYIISANENGDTLWTKTLGKPGGEDRCFDIQYTSGNNFIIAGTTFDPVNLGEATLTLMNDETIPTKVVENQISPEGFYLSDAYPNPFNPSARINFTIGSKQFVSLKIYDVLGNEVQTLINETKSPGKYEVEFSARGGSASSGNAFNLPSGVYLYRIKAGNFIQTKKMLLLK